MPSCSQQRAAGTGRGNHSHWPCLISPSAKYVQCPCQAARTESHTNKEKGMQLEPSVSGFRGGGGRARSAVWPHRKTAAPAACRPAQLSIPQFAPSPIACESSALYIEVQHFRKRNQSVLSANPVIPLSMIKIHQGWCHGIKGSQMAQFNIVQPLAKI